VVVVDDDADVNSVTWMLLLLMMIGTMTMMQKHRQKLQLIFTHKIFRKTKFHISQPLYTHLNLCQT